MNRRVLLALGAVVALGACGEAAASRRVQSGRPASRRPPSRSETTAEAEAPEITEAPTRQGSAGTMPDVVGMDLQAAQDRIQAETDVFWSDSRDATRAGPDADHRLELGRCGPVTRRRHPPR